jgi:general secretion pathway protein G
MHTIAFRKSYGTATLAIIVVGLLVAVLWLASQFLKPGAGKNAKGAATKIMLSNFDKSLRAYKVAFGRYPTTADGLRALVEKPANDAARWKGPYMKSIPLDPWGHEFQYACPGTHNVRSYDLYSFGPDGQPGSGDDIVNWEQASVR